MTRVFLINFVLMRIHMYSTQVYVLPKSVLSEIYKVLKFFLWSGQVYSQRSELVVWEKLCCDKKEGGLGFKDIVMWNIAFMGRYVWGIVTKKDNVWIRWVDVVYIYDNQRYGYVPTQGVSWYWKKICDTKDIFK